MTAVDPQLGSRALLRSRVPHLAARVLEAIECPTLAQTSLGSLSEELRAVAKALDSLAARTFSEAAAEALTREADPNLRDALEYAEQHVEEMTAALGADPVLDGAAFERALVLIADGNPIDPLLRAAALERARVRRTLSDHLARAGEHRAADLLAVALARPAQGDAP